MYYQYKTNESFSITHYHEMFMFTCDCNEHWKCKKEAENCFYSEKTNNYVSLATLIIVFDAVFYQCWANVFIG